MAFERIIAISLFLAVPMVSVASDASAATPNAEASETKLSIKATVEHDGATLAAAGTSTVGGTAKLRAADDAHAHDLSVTVLSSSDKGYAVKIAYKRDGKRVVKAKTVEVSGDELTLDVKGSKITVSLAPAKRKRSRIDLPKSDDPLAGL
jgi:hypothetical protein